MSRRTELEPVARELLEILRDEFEGKADPEDRDTVRLVVSLMSDAYDLGRKAEAAEFVTLANRRRQDWHEITRTI